MNSSKLLERACKSPHYRLFLVLTRGFLKPFRLTKSHAVKGFVMTVPRLCPFPEDRRASDAAARAGYGRSRDERLWSAEELIDASTAKVEIA